MDFLHHGSLATRNGDLEHIPRIILFALREPIDFRGATIPRFRTDLLGAMPQEVAVGDVPRLDDVEKLRRLLMDAEATVLARLAASGEGA